MNIRKLKYAWWLGGLGSLAWMPILGVVWLAHGYAFAGLLALALSAAGVGYVFLLPPWRFPHAPIRRFYFGLLAVVFAGAAVAVWLFWSRLADAGGFPLLFLFAVFVGPLVQGRKSWAELTGSE